MVGRRFIALFIDLEIGILSGAFIVMGLLNMPDFIIGLVGLTAAHLSDYYDLLLTTPAMGFTVLFLWLFAWPCILGGFLSYSFKTTIGKFLMRLEVMGKRGGRLSFGHAVGREIIKMIMIWLSPLWILPLLQAILHDTTFYDDYLGAIVVRKTRASRVQANFRKYYGNR